jgi:hypothetical protein
LNQFKELNEGAEVHYCLKVGKIDSIFLGPNFMNDSLCYVRPAMSLDAAHLKSTTKETMYLGTVKTGLNDICTVAIAIERSNKDMMVGITFYH